MPRRAPAVLNAIIGDAVHNLRASLDYLAWQLVIATGGTPPDKTTYFPVHERRPRTRGSVRLPDIRPGVPVPVRKLLDEVQPYKRAKPAHHQLAILNNLDIGDKHHELLVTILGVKSASVRGDAEVTGFSFGPYDNGSEICRFAYSVRTIRPSPIPASFSRYASISQRRDRAGS